MDPTELRCFAKTIEKGKIIQWEKQIRKLSRDQHKFHLDQMHVMRCGKAHLHINIEWMEIPRKKISI